MKKKLLVLIITAGMISSGFSMMNTFASDFDDDAVSFAAEMEQSDDAAGEASFADTESSFAKEPEDSFSDTENPSSEIDSTSETEILEDSQISGPTPTPIPSWRVSPAPTPTSESTPTSEPIPSPTCSPTPSPTTVSPTPAPTRVPSFLTYKSGSLAWEDHTTVSLKMSVTRDCKWYYFYADSGTSISVIQNMYNADLAVNPAAADTEFTVRAENVPEADFWLVVCAKPVSGKAQMRVFKLDSSSFKEKRPAIEPTITTRAARTHKVTESTVKGLEKTLKFYPGKFYDFTVTGAGQNDKAPYVSGDERWIPVYWSTSKNPSFSQKNTAWRVGSVKGISEKKTHNLYIFFQKQIFNGSAWEDTDVIESITCKFTSEAIKADEGNGTLTPKTNVSSVVLRTGQSTSAVKVTNATSSFRVTAWYSDDTSIAKVDSRGKITAGKKAGSTYIRIAMSTGKKAKVKVTVQKGIVRTNSISGLKTKYTVAKGKTVTLKPVRSPITSQEKITYSSSDKKIATVSSQGVIKGIKAGTAKITVRSGSKKVIITVNVPKVSTSKISDVKSAITLKKGKTFKITPKLTPSNTDDKVSYSSTDSKIATVNAKGVVTARKKGTATITVKSGKIQVKCKVTVK